jgi:DNA gyrase/topoisomerase IV subunit A
MVKNQRILDVLFRDDRIAPLFGYRTICDFVHPSVSHLELVESNGNHGSPDFSEASTRYTEPRLSPLGEAALLAERRERSAFPIGLIDAVGAPTIPTGCHVGVDMVALAAGQKTAIRREAHIEQTERGELVISRLPPRSSASDIATGIERRIRHVGSDALPITDLNDASSGGQTHIVLRFIEHTDPGSVARQLRDVWGVHTTFNVELEAPLPTMLQTWVARHGDTDLPEQLRPITEAAR